MSAPYIAKKPRVTAHERKIAEDAAKLWHTLDHACEHHASILRADPARAAQAQEEYVRIYNPPPIGSMPAADDMESAMKSSQAIVLELAHCESFLEYVVIATAKHLIDLGLTAMCGL
jgi:hypothetical protein